MDEGRGTSQGKFYYEAGWGTATNCGVLTGDRGGGGAERGWWDSEARPLKGLQRAIVSGLTFHQGPQI